MEMATAPARLKTTPSWLINQVAIQASRLVTDGLAAEGAHRQHYSVLAALDEFGPASQAALGRRCGIDRSDMVALLNDLAAQHFVERTPDPEDRRRNVITITPDGVQRLNYLAARITAIQDELLAPLSPAERDHLIGVLQRLLAHHTGR